MSDDGIGVLLAQELKKLRWPPGVQVLEIGTSVFNYQEEISLSQHVIVVDAVNAGGSPGCVYRLGVEDIVENPERDPHNVSILDIIRLARQVKGLPETVTIYGVQPGDLSFGGGLTPAVACALSKITFSITNDVGRLIKKGRVNPTETPFL